MQYLLLLKGLKFPARKKVNTCVWRLCSVYQRNQHHCRTEWGPRLKHIYSTPFSPIPALPVYHWEIFEKRSSCIPCTFGKRSENQLEVEQHFNSKFILRSEVYSGLTSTQISEIAIFGQWWTTLNNNIRFLSSSHQYEYKWFHQNGEKIVIKSAKISLCWAEHLMT